MVEATYEQARQARDVDLARARAIGQGLREARQEHGEDLYDIAEFLRIRPSYLFALEEGNLDAMPGRPYAFGFLRTYADYLGFDGHAVVEQVKAPLETVQAQPEPQPRRPLKPERMPSGPIVAAVILIVALAGGTWYLAGPNHAALLEQARTWPGEIGRQAAGLFEGDDPVPASPDLGETASIEPDPSDPAGVVLAPGDESASSSTSAPSSSSAEAEEESAAETLVRLEARALDADGDGSAGEESGDVSLSEMSGGGSGLDARADTMDEAPSGEDRDTVTASAATEGAASDAQEGDRQEADAQEEEGSAADLLAELRLEAEDGAGEAEVYGSANDDARVVLVARESSWIQVQSRGRDYVRTRTLEPGDRFLLPDRDDLALWTGNAGGLEIHVDGESLGILGERGAVMRDVSLAPEALRGSQD